jgi:hypothetical protein
MRGVISYVTIGKPTIQEMESCTWINLTAEAEWDPHSNAFEENEKQAHENEKIVTDPIDRHIHAIQSLPFVQNDVVLEALPTSLMNENELLPRAIQSVAIQNVQSTQRRGKITQEELSHKWKISLETSAKTLKATTQLTIRNDIHPIQRRFRTEVAQLRHPRLGGRFGRFSSDTMFSKTPSIRGNSSAQVFVSNIDFCRLIPMRRKAEAGDASVEFIQDIGIPQTLEKWKQTMQKFQIKQTLSQPYSPWQVRAERCICEIKKSVRRLMDNTKAPKCLWDYCAVYACEIRSLSA